ncbi:MAG: amidoligase family protein [Xanthomonadales bacterium]|nr:amidoligase family protein [Xanthomonadales bacterium]
MPATTQKPDGSSRQVGVEIELQGIAVDELAKVVCAAIGGDIHEVSRSEFELEVPSQGTYRIEVDYALLKELAKEEAQGGNDDMLSQDWVLEALDTISAIVVPCEIVSPPLPMETIGEPMDAIVNAVREAGANGTNASIAYAFGVHLNVEPPDMQAATILSFMRAFVCLFDWLVWAGKVDLSRRVTPYINSFPRDYQALILDSDYDPDFATLTADYLEHNATRNRALDMLPMLASVDENAVFDAVDDDRVNARPTFHYRLENSCVDEPDWSIADSWNRWFKVEQLAADEDARSMLCAEMLADADRFLHPVDNHWRKRVQSWVEQS